jgi:hypothetical protein
LDLSVDDPPLVRKFLSARYKPTLGRTARGTASLLPRRLRLDYLGGTPFRSVLLGG